MNENKQLETFVKTKQGDYVVSMIDACENDGKYTEAYPTGFKMFDEAMKVSDEGWGGVRDGDLVVITGKSGEGKTTFAQNLTMNFTKEGFPCLWFSYEMIIDNITAKFKHMKVKMERDESLIYSPKKIKDGDLKWIKEIIIDGRERYNVKMIFIDHIDFLKAPDFSNKEQRRIVLRDICQELKNIARDLKVVVILMAHVRKVQNQEIEMQDVAESSGIYQLADYLFAIQRGQTKTSWGGVTNQSKNIIKLLKNRYSGQLPFTEFNIENNIINIIKPL